LRSASSFSHGTVSGFAGWSRGSGAPIAIHLSKSAMTASLSFGRFDGIFRSGSSWRMDFRSRLFSGLPGMIVSPESPPFFQPSRKSRRRPPFCFFASWHSWHSPARRGRIFVSKKFACSCVSVVAASVALPMRGEMKGAQLVERCRPGGPVASCGASLFLRSQTQKFALPVWLWPAGTAALHCCGQ
jgi:hypothetical protein